MYKEKDDGILKLNSNPTIVKATGIASTARFRLAMKQRALYNKSELFRELSTLGNHLGGLYMGIVELCLVAIGLAMDAFAVSICKGLSLGKIKWKHMCIAGLWFGGFQALMPAMGYFFGSFFTDYITLFAHWIAFGLLLFIGSNMIRESFKKCCETMDRSMTAKSMFILAIATSIDALAVGVSFAFMKVPIVGAVIVIGGITFCVAAIGVKVGSLFGDKYKSKAELMGGVVLIAMAINILLTR